MTFYKMTPSTLSTFDERAAKDNLAHPGARIDEEVTVRVEPLSRVFGSISKGGAIDFLSVDTEGLDSGCFKATTGTIPASVRVGRDCVEG